MNRRTFLQSTLAAAVMPLAAMIPAAKHEETLRACWKLDRAEWAARRCRMHAMRVDDIVAIEGSSKWWIVTGHPRLLPTGIWEVEVKPYEEAQA